MIKIVADSTLEKDFVAQMILKSDKKIDAFIYDSRKYPFDGENSCVTFVPDDNLPQLTSEGFCISVNEFLRSGTVHPETALIYTCGSISEDLENMAEKLEEDKVIKRVILIGNRK